MYWKERFNDEIKLHGGQGDIHEEMYHRHAPYYGQVQFFVGLRDRWRTWYKNKQPWPLHRCGYVDIFLTAVLQNLFEGFIFLGNITSDAQLGLGTSQKKGSNTLEVTSYINIQIHCFGDTVEPSLVLLLSPQANSP